MDEIKEFCEIVRKRSSEHSEAMDQVSDLPGMMVSDIEARIGLNG